MSKDIIIGEDPQDSKPEEAIKALPKFMPHNPLTKGMPAHLKDPRNYEKIYKTIYDAGGTTCNHSEVGEMATCFKCIKAQGNRLMVMKKLGFQSGKQYIMWLRIHQNIRTYHRDKLEKFNS
jgi:hypothetical protein